MVSTAFQQAFWPHMHLIITKPCVLCINQINHLSSQHLNFTLSEN